MALRVNIFKRSEQAAKGDRSGGLLSPVARRTPAQSIAAATQSLRARNGDGSARPVAAAWEAPRGSSPMPSPRRESMAEGRRMSAWKPAAEARTPRCSPIPSMRRESAADSGHIGSPPPGRRSSRLGSKPMDSGLPPGRRSSTTSTAAAKLAAGAAAAARTMPSLPSLSAGGEGAPRASMQRRRESWLGGERRRSVASQDSATWVDVLGRAQQLQESEEKTMRILMPNLRRRNSVELSAEFDNLIFGAPEVAMTIDLPCIVPAECDEEPEGSKTSTLDDLDIVEVRPSSAAGGLRSQQ